MAESENLQKSSNPSYPLKFSNSKTQMTNKKYISEQDRLQLLV